MDLIGRASNIILHPRSEWEKIKSEKIDIVDMLSGYALYLAAIGPIASFIGYGLVGRFIHDERITYSLPASFLYGALAYVFNLGLVLFLGFVIDLLAPSFRAERNVNASMKVAFFALTPAWLAAVFNIVPSLSFLNLIGLYYLYLLYTGLRILKNPAPEKQAGYFLIVFMIILAAQIIAGMILFGLIFGTYALAV